MTGVVITLPTQRLAHHITTVVAFIVNRGAPQRVYREHTADTPAAYTREKNRRQSGANRHGQQDPVGDSAAPQPRRPPCTAPNDGAVKVTNTAVELQARGIPHNHAVIRLDAAPMQRDEAVAPPQTSISAGCGPAGDPGGGWR